MPIIDVELVVEQDELLPENLASDLADGARELFSSPEGGTWVRVRRLPRVDYGEDGDGPPSEVRPVFVTVLKGQIPPVGLLETEVAGLTHVVARCCRRPAENVHILYQPPAVGRVAFGGRLVTGPRRSSGWGV